MFDIEKSNVITNSLPTSCNLNKDKDLKPVEESEYRGMASYLLYLTTSPPNMIFVVCMCAQFQAFPKESHISMVKRILTCLSGTQQMGLWYPKGADCDLVGYSNSDFVGSILDRKSTSSICHLLGNSFVLWHSKKKASVTLSTVEEENVVVDNCCAQLILDETTSQ
ncbi:secreted RxLR effector protein 161-like [Vicia villosa]|uniref:secreted RxLR effector protein 161-like n=1 Tax=Vicia villosa TaxID=3911 RepID=UPI00273AD975|nr:secreted RxLR effector protein 161-like [Vicia villosa]